MIVQGGKKGLTCSFQQDWKATVKCIHCGEKAVFSFAVMEGLKEKEYIYQQRGSNSEEVWFHDLVAVAVYFCPRCLKATAKVNQA